jgi:hypothetical protein
MQQKHGRGEESYVTVPNARASRSPRPHFVPIAVWLGRFFLGSWPVDKAVPKPLFPQSASSPSLFAEQRG